MTAKDSQTQRSPAVKLNIAGLVVAAAGIMIQYASGVDYPTIPPGPIILLVAAALVAFGPRRWAPVVGLAVPLFVSIGGAVATLAGDGFTTTLGDPSEVGGFIGAVVQIAGLVIAVPAGVVGVRRSSGSRAETSPA
jgi:hypothetical protein